MTLAPSSGGRLRAAGGGLALALGLSACAPAEGPAPLRDAARPPPGVSAADHGARLLAEGRPETASRAFRHALAEEGPTLPVLLGLGASARGEGQSGEALRLFTEAVRRFPGSPAARNALGAALYDRGDPAAAADQFRTALRLAEATGADTGAIALNLALAERAAPPPAPPPDDLPTIPEPAA